MGTALGRNARVTGRNLADLVKKGWLHILPFSGPNPDHRPPTVYEALIPGPPLTPVDAPHYLLRVLVQVHADATPTMIQTAREILERLGLGVHDLTVGHLYLDRDGLTLREALHFKHQVFLATSLVSGISGALTFYGELYDRQQHPGAITEMDSLDRRQNGQYQYEAEGGGVQRLPGLVYSHTRIKLLRYAPTESVVVLRLDPAHCMPALQSGVRLLPAPVTYLTAPGTVAQGRQLKLTDPTTGEQTLLVIAEDQVSRAAELGAQALFARLQARQLPHVHPL
ncbi:hypothetical protein [Deinococcus multiflagellatus]|uniref:hypothetical protein n=1 Tax=Deinococcus multiflagellatus TaxID=1656887 RepID=UPI001CCDF502|nr:hypothetical protein [Deinococcus multiflagellatus]MBZ9714948.1 hypothetical protein [Deinococcus multiflagellatus]